MVGLTSNFIESFYKQTESCAKLPQHFSIYQCNIWSNMTVFTPPTIKNEIHFLSIPPDSQLSYHFLLFISHLGYAISCYLQSLVSYHLYIYHIMIFFLILVHNSDLSLTLPFISCLLLFLTTDFSTLLLHRRSLGHRKLTITTSFVSVNLLSYFSPL